MARRTTAKTARPSGHQAQKTTQGNGGDAPEQARLGIEDMEAARIAARLWAERGVKADASMLSRFLQSERIRLQKNVRAAEQLRPDVAARRAVWRAAQPELAGRRLIFLDETGAATDMTRRRGWAPVGERAVGYAPAGHWRTTTFLAGLAAEALVVARRGIRTPSEG